MRYYKYLLIYALIIIIIQYYFLTCLYIIVFNIKLRTISFIHLPTVLLKITNIDSYLKTKVEVSKLQPIAIILSGNKNDENGEMVFIYYPQLLASQSVQQNPIQRHQTGCNGYYHQGL